MLYDSDMFYKKNYEFITDISEYCPKIKEAFEFIIKEVCNKKMQIETFYITMIPFKPGIRGVLMNLEGDISEFECDDIRSGIGHYFHSIEIDEFEKNYRKEIDENKLNLKKCELYSKLKDSDISIRRNGALENKIPREVMIKKIFPSLKKKANNHIFISDWVEYGPFIILFITELSRNYYLQYKKIANTKENENNINLNFQFFLDTIVRNFYSKWLEFIYYGLSYSTIDYISDSQAIIEATANDMFNCRSLPSERIFTKIANYKYEGRSCNGKILFTRNTNNIIKFEEQIEISIENARKIRKLLEITDNDIYMIADISSGKIVGVSNHKIQREGYLLDFTGTNMWELSFNQKYILKYINGQYRIPEPKINKQIFIEKCKERFGPQNYNNSIFKIISAASNQTHGTIIVISANAKSETNAIIKSGKGIAISPTNLIEQSPKIITRLCSIDGAIIIDTSGICYGIGLILSNSNKKNGNPERGARYNSALNYVNDSKDRLAVVISEDGMIDIL